MLDKTLGKVDSFAKKNPLMVASFLIATVGTVGSLGFGIASDVENKRLANTLYPLALLGVWGLELRNVIHNIDEHPDQVAYK